MGRETRDTPKEPDELKDREPGYLGKIGKLKIVLEALVHEFEDLVEMAPVYRNHFGPFLANRMPRKQAPKSRGDQFQLLEAIAPLGQRAMQQEECLAKLGIPERALHKPWLADQAQVPGYLCNSRIR